MSGSAGGNRIPRAAVDKTAQDYIDKVLSKFPGFKKAKISGSYNTGTKADFGDIDLIVQLEGEDKKLIKQELVKYFSSLSDSIIVPFKSDKYKGKKSLSSGELVTILYPITGIPDQYVQIDNIVSVSEEELTFKNTFLDYPAEVQGLILGLAKIICLEEDPKSIFKRLGITNVPALEPNQEYEFNLSSAGLTLRIVTLDNLKEVNRTEVWKSSDWNTVKKLFANYNIDADFKTLLKELSTKLKNPRSKNRIKGIFKSMVSIKSGEVNTPKGDNKQMALDSVDSLLENMLFKGLVKELISSFINEEDTKKTIALYPGAFKPPHRGHFELVQRLSKVADEVIIVISPIAREGVTADQSLSAWKLYLPLLPKAKAIISNVASPVKYVYDYIDANPQQDVVVAYGKGEEGRYKALLNTAKYPNVKIYDAGDIDGLSASNLRNAINSKNPTDIAKFLPAGIEVEDYMNALDYNLRTEPTFKSVTENIETPDLDFTKALASLTKYYVDNGYNVKPLPKVKIVSNDTENASSVLGKTAYYEPSNKSITLFTAGRHPKDILRSFSHEMIHHIQNLENRLTNITTTNTTEDDHLSQLEQEAYLNGNMALRNWEDSIKN
jgi:cytidyltransferase-like protein